MGGPELPIRQAAGPRLTSRVVTQPTCDTKGKIGIQRHRPRLRAFLRRIARFIVAVARSRELSFARMAVPPPGDG